MPSAAPLGYGQALRSGDVTCVSRRTGVECRNAVTGHGFTASRASFDTYQDFPPTLAAREPAGPDQGRRRSAPQLRAAGGGRG